MYNSSFSHSLYNAILSQLTKQLSKLTTAHAALRQQLAEAESHIEASTGQVVVLLAREKQLLQERRDLYRQLDKLRLEMARNSGYCCKSRCQE